MIKLNSTQYVFSWIAIVIVSYLKPQSLEVSCVLISIICASYFLGRGITQNNTGAPSKGWKSPEVQFLIFNFGYALWAYSCQADTLMVTYQILIGIVTYNIGRGLAKHYKPNNPLILR